ncbi:MAG: hypothetical protein KatS3mg115_2058 [Candidatus Poribacteria bacterium]|nr:MAG: hypothetical protein KatS3mg115_2058 [Candidatus Poribacteria bacterium]
MILFLWFARPRWWSLLFGTLLLALGETIRLAAVCYIGGSCRTRGERPGKRLVREGPFELVRNPLYLGNFLIVLGVATMVARWELFLIAVLLFWAQYLPIVYWEERTLLEQFGEAYRQYAASVPRFFPRRWRWKRPTERAPMPLLSALFLERRTLLAEGLTLVAFLLRWTLEG